MRFLFLFTAALCAFAQTLPPLVDIAVSPEWLKESRFKAAQVDAQGNVIFAGGLSPAATIPGATNIGPLGAFSSPVVIVKMDAQLEHVLYATRVGGATGGEYVNTMQVRADGGVVLAGSTSSFDFPTTAGPVPGTGNEPRSFLLILGPDGKLEYSRVYPSEIFLQRAQVGSDGDIYIAGGAKTTDLPSTTGAYTPDHPGNTFVGRLTAKTMEPKFIVHLEDTMSGLQGIAVRPEGGLAVLMGPALLALDASGSRLDFQVPTLPEASLAAEGGVYTVIGTVASGPTGEGLQASDIEYSSMIQQYSLDGRLLGKMNLPGLYLSGPSVAGSDGTAYVGGVSGAASATTYNGLQPCNNNRPPMPNAQDANLVVVGPAEGLRYASFSSIMYQALAIGGTRYLYGVGANLDTVSAVQGAQMGFYRLDMQGIPTGKHVAPSCIANAASYTAGPATPGELMTIYGSGLGPDAGESFGLVNGRAPMSLAGTSVTVDGAAAPILYTQDTQINFIVPWSLRTQGTVPVCVTRGSETKCIDSAVGLANLGVFSANGAPIIARQDWSLVSATNRPLPGEVVTLWLTGTGSLDSVPQDGEVVGLALRHVAAPVRVLPESCGAHGCPVLPGAMPWPVEYAGSAPGMLAGITQLNVRFLSDSTTAYGVRLQISAGDSGTVEVIF